MTRGLVAGVALLALLSFAPPASAQDTLTVDFETGPALETPINDDYLTSHFVRFLHADYGFRPYRRNVGTGPARSGC